jgi:thioredoxin 1
MLSLRSCRTLLGSARGNSLSNEREPFISEESELKRIREKKLIELKERRHVMSGVLVHITDAEFDEIVKKNTLAMVDFWASWCGPCMALAPTIEEVAKEYSGRVLVGKLNVDENPKTAECFQVYSIPTMVIMRKGQEVDRIVGCVQKKIIKAALDKHLRQE